MIDYTVLHLIFRRIIILFIVSILSAAPCCTRKGGDDAENQQTQKKKAAVPEDDMDLIPVTVKNIIGRWNLTYGNDYGYSFTFNKNFKSIVVIYLKYSAIIFKGVYTIEDSGHIRINIIEMKNEDSLQNINYNSGFIKTQKSFFLFKSGLKDKEKKQLVIKPERIIIDGTNSEGYFEPVIKLELI